MKKLIKIIKCNLVFSFDVKSTYKSIWIGPLLITWCFDVHCKRIEEFDFTWYGFDYWMPQKVKLNEGGESIS